jgi:hypothetical protein
MHRTGAGSEKDFWHAAQQAYSLDPVMGVQKFGPHHVVLKTSLSNIRLTTFFAGESEVKIIDPSRLSSGRSRRLPSGVHPSSGMSRQRIPEISC